MRSSGLGVETTLPWALDFFRHQLLSPEHFILYTVSVSQDEEEAGTSSFSP